MTMSTKETFSTGRCARPEAHEAHSWTWRGEGLRCTPEMAGRRLGAGYRRRFVTSVLAILVLAIALLVAQPSRTRSGAFDVSKECAAGSLLVTGHAWTCTAAAGYDSTPPGGGSPAYPNTHDNGTSGSPRAFGYWLVSSRYVAQYISSTLYWGDAVSGHYYKIGNVKFDVCWQLSGADHHTIGTCSDIRFSEKVKFLTFWDAKADGAPNSSAGNGAGTFHHEDADSNIANTRNTYVHIPAGSGATFNQWSDSQHHYHNASSVWQWSSGDYPGLTWSLLVRSPVAYTAALGAGPAAYYFSLASSLAGKAGISHHYIAELLGVGDGLVPGH